MGQQDARESTSVSAKDEPVPHSIEESKYDRKLNLNGWEISTSKRPISNSREIDEASDRLTIPLPEMIFGNNNVRVRHAESGIDIEWNTIDALDAVDKNGTDLKVSYSADWNKTRDEHSEEIKHVTKPFDWTYTTDYRGTLRGVDHEKNLPRWVETEELLPMELLKRQDPILFYDEVILYESELDDNGTSLLTVRVRVMPERLLILSRFFMRLDDVTFRIRDTRIYIEFATKKVLREYLVRQESYKNIRANVKPYQEDQLGELMADANWVCQHAGVIDGKMEVLKF